MTAPHDPRPAPSELEAFGFRMVLIVQILVVFVSGSIAATAGYGFSLLVFGLGALDPGQPAMLAGVVLIAALVGWLVTLPHTALTVAAVVSAKAWRSVAMGRHATIATMVFYAVATVDFFLTTAESGVPAELVEITTGLMVAAYAAAVGLTIQNAKQVGRS